MTTTERLVDVGASQDFDVPGRIAALPFVSEHAERNILGETARKVFELGDVAPSSRPA